MEHSCFATTKRTRNLVGIVVAIVVIVVMLSVQGCAVAAGALVGTAIRKTSNERVSAREANCVKIHEVNTQRE